ncbi:MAG: thiamine pyrophosphate-dependent enzyme [Candidatus Bathyarchaeia archaeon]|jgi:pyruvate ferredoxin oxidoreductase beta subunit
MVTLKELSTQELFGPGHRMCTGCGPAAMARITMKALQKPAIVVNATGCLEVASTIYPDTAWKVPWVHTLFENTAAVASGIEASLRREGKTDAVDIVAFGGDGGTFDIGIQALSGALERKHDFTYICYDNEAYMNTGIQRSGATPYGAATTTTPAGSKIGGKTDAKKDLIGVCVAHSVEFAATASVAFWNDYITKVRRAAAVKGPAVIHVLAPCPLGWRFDTSQTIKLAKLAVQTRYFPLYEVEKGNYKLSMKVPNPTPLEEFLKPQGRFRHLFAPEFAKNLEELKRQVESNWNRVARLCGEITASASPSPSQPAN